MKKSATVALSAALALSLASPAFAKSQGKGMGSAGRGQENRPKAMMVKEKKESTAKRAMKKVMKEACITKRSLERAECKTQFRSNAKSMRENAHTMVRGCTNLFGMEKAACLKKQRGGWRGTAKSPSSASPESSESGSEGSSSSEGSSY